LGTYVQDLFQQFRFKSQTVSATDKLPVVMRIVFQSSVLKDLHLLFSGKVW